MQQNNAVFPSRDKAQNTQKKIAPSGFLCVFCFFFAANLAGRDPRLPASFASFTQQNVEEVLKFLSFWHYQARSSQGSQKPAGNTALARCDMLRRAGVDDFAAGGAALGAEVDHPIAGGD